jgi:hypothetical protein
MLTDTQYKAAWEGQIAGEVRSLYFADLTSRYGQQRRAITFLTFFVSSGAAVTEIIKFPLWVAFMLWALVALMAAYSLTTGLDRKITTMSALNGDWANLAVEYENLRDNPDVEEAVSVLTSLQRRSIEASQTATTDAPNDRKRMARWTDHVFESRGLTSLASASNLPAGRNG